MRARIGLLLSICETCLMLAPHDSRCRWPRHGWWNQLVCLVLALGTACGGGQLPAQTTAAQNKVLPRIASGTLVEDPQADRWNQVVLLARPKISSGDTDALPASVQTAVSSLILSIVATVKQESQTSGEPYFRLAEVGVGYATSVDGELKIVTLQGAAAAGKRLGFFQRQMLSENEKQIAAIPILAHTSTLLIFDTPSILQRDAQHRDFVMRHFVWINSQSGKLSMLVWLLREDSALHPSEGLRVVDEPLRWVPAGMKEVREIHVDGKEFSLLGIPSERAFALEDLPPGKQIPWTPEAQAFAGLRSFSDSQLRELTIALNAALQALREP